MEQPLVNAQFTRIVERELPLFTLPTDIVFASVNPLVEDMGRAYIANDVHVDDKKVMAVAKAHNITPDQVRDHAARVAMVSLLQGEQRHEDDDWRDFCYRVANDPDIRNVVCWVLENDLYDTDTKLDYYDHASNIMRQKHGVPVDECKYILDLCENSILDGELAYGEA